jgi:hypothetical protein
MVGITTHGNIAHGFKAWAMFGGLLIATVSFSFFRFIEYFL